MESVENLMIGKETAFLVVIDKALVDSLVHRCKTDVVSLQFLTAEDILESLLLFQAIS